MSSIISFYSLERLLASAKAEFSDPLCTNVAIELTFRVIDSLVLVSEAAWRVSALLRPDAHAMELSLLGCHEAAVTLEGIHGGLGASVQSLDIGDAGIPAIVSNNNSSLLSRGQLLDKALRRARARLRRGPLIGSGHRLHDEVLVIIVPVGLHLDRLELLLQAALLNV